MIRTLKFCTSLFQKNLIKKGNFCHSYTNASFSINDLASDLKIAPQRLEAAFNKNENLYKSNKTQWLKCFQELKNQGFRTEHSLNIITAVPQLLHHDEKFIINAVDAWRDCQFGESTVLYLLSLHPYFLTLPKAHVLHRTNELSKFIGKKKQVTRLLEINPNLMFTKWQHINEIMAYIKNVMKITDISEICKSNVFQSSLDTLKCRYTFLQKLGIYKVRNPKASELEPNPNPKLAQITITDDAVFATEIAGVTLEEFRVYQQMCLEAKDEDVDEDDFSDDDEENQTIVNS